MESHEQGLDETTFNVFDNEHRCSEGDGDGGSNEIEYGTNEEDDDEMDWEDINSIDNRISINGKFDVVKFDMKNMTASDVARLEFADLQLVFEFYSAHGRSMGFSVRKSHIVKNCLGNKIQQTFVCSREGFRENRGLTLDIRRREPKNESRCECPTMFRVHVDYDSDRWHVRLFNLDHNHEMLNEINTALLPSHRKMTEANMLQIENFNKVGIRPPHMYASFANIVGGYHKVGFLSRDIYNKFGKQRREQLSDVSGALHYLQELCSKDHLMFVSYTVDDNTRLQHLFWCDGESRMNFEVFGDVVAFDATYKKNKYLCPFVIFSGVNHHNQTIVFATALVTNETEETYIGCWNNS